jgi:hypothetical protein
LPHNQALSVGLVTLAAEAQALKISAMNLIAWQRKEGFDISFYYLNIIQLYLKMFGPNLGAQ